MFLLYANKNQLTVQEREPMTSGSARVYLLQVKFSGDWAGLDRTVYFRAGERTAAQTLDDTNACTIPARIVDTDSAGMYLFAGVRGTDAAGVVLPTVWVNLGLILDGAAPGESSPGVGDGAYVPVPGLQGPPGPQGEQGPQGAPGADGAPGNDATINGVNTLEIAAGENVTIQQDGGTLTISATGPGGGGDGVPSGVIVMWSGNDAPDGWALCDGENGTPDLRGRFVLGESDAHISGETGGSENVTLTVEQMPEHGHMYSSFESEVSDKGFFSGAFTVPVNTSINETELSGSSQPHPNMPPYYVLAYIMKL